MEEEDREVQQAADAMMTAELPPSCLDVTIALRFMVDKDNSSITFHQVRLTLLWRNLPTFLRRFCTALSAFLPVYCCHLRCDNLHQAALCQLSHLVYDILHHTALCQLSQPEL